MSENLEDKIQFDQAYESYSNTSHLIILSKSKNQTLIRAKYNLKKQLSSLPIITKKPKEKE